MLLNHQKKMKLWLVFSVFVSCLMVSNLNIKSIVSAQSNWSLPQRIPGYTIDIDNLPPDLIADRNNTVHSFASEWIEDGGRQLVIVYSSWTLDGGWTKPVDIIISPVKEARILGVALDDFGIFHLIFFGGEEPSGDLYYTQAPALQVSQSSSWSPPELIGKNAIIPNSGAIIADKQGNLYVLYAGNLINGRGIYFLKSQDKGNNWTEPYPIFLSTDPPFGTRFVAGESGFYHAVWYVVDDLGHNISAHYSRYDLKDDKWDKPIDLAEGYGINEGMGISNIEVIEFKGQVFIMFNNGIPPSGVPPSQWFLVSRDGGQTWEEPYRPFPQHVGRNGSIAFVVDSDENLHVLFADRIPIFSNGQYSSIGGVYHSVWLDDHWTYPDPVVDTSQGIDIQNGVFGGYDVRAVIVQGNKLLCLWRNDPGLQQLGVWFSYKILNSPEYSTELLPTVDVNQNARSTSVSETENPTPTPVIEIEKTKNPQNIATNAHNSNFSSGIIVGIIFTFLLILVVFIYRIRKIYR